MTKKKTTKKTTKKGGKLDLGDIMHATADEDAENAKLGAAAKHVKQCHLLIRELDIGLRHARCATAPQSTIRHVLERVTEAVIEISTEAENATKALLR